MSKPNGKVIKEAKRMLAYYKDNYSNTQIIDDWIAMDDNWDLHINVLEGFFSAALYPISVDVIHTETGFDLNDL